MAQPQKLYANWFCLCGQSTLSVSNARYDHVRRYGIGGNVISESFSCKMSGVCQVIQTIHSW